MEGDLANLFVQSVLFGCVVFSVLLAVTLPVWVLIKFLRLW
jgi:hypothetical protein